MRNVSGKVAEKFKTPAFICFQMNPAQFACTLLTQQMSSREWRKNDLVHQVFMSGKGKDPRRESADRRVFKHKSLVNPSRSEQVRSGLEHLLYFTRRN